MTYEEYCEEVAKKLELRGLEELETIYGDMIHDCYDLGDSIDECVRYCRYDDDEYSGKDRKPIVIN